MASIKMKNTAADEFNVFHADKKYVIGSQISKDQAREFVAAGAALDLDGVFPELAPKAVKIEKAVAPQRNVEKTTVQAIAEKLNKPVKDIVKLLKEKGVEVKAATDEVDPEVAASLEAAKEQ